MDMPATESFIARHGLWTDAQAGAARELAARVEREPLDLIRLVWTDSHGHARAKSVSAPVFLESLERGYNINVATWTLDASGGRVFRSFTRGGGMDLDEMTGSPNLIVVPDPATFRTLPWAPGVGWVLCDEYFGDGTPFHFSSRHLLRRVLARLAERGMTAVVGIEAEWYLAQLAQDGLDEPNVGELGRRGAPLRTRPPESGFSYHSESNMDLMQPVLGELARAYAAIGLPLRSIENEWGPGQVECTFGARDAMVAADDYLLFRSATRQVCRRQGWFATFMCQPGLKGHYPNGWHLHLSLVDAVTGRNLLAPDGAGELLSPFGRAFLAGMLEHADATAVFATPTVNGYRRFRANSLAPDRVTWGHDHRGVMVRLLGGPGDEATRFENRIGEPAANPYLYVAAQIAAGLDGVDRSLEPCAPDDDPYEADRPMLPTSLGAALDALDGSAAMRRVIGDRFIDYYLSLKRAELARYEAFLADAGADPAGGITQWEMNEYYDFF